MSGEKCAHIRGLSDKACWALWLVWSMVLAAIPRTVRPGLEPSVPGLSDIYLLDIAVFVAAFAGLVAPYCGMRFRNKLEYIAKPVLVALGLVATLVLLIAEAYVDFVGHESLGYRRCGQQLIAVEFFAGLLSLLGWMNAQPKGEGGRLRQTPIAVGFCCPLIVALLSGIPLFREVPLTRCGLSAALLGGTLLVLRGKNLLFSRFAFFYTVGQLLFSSAWWGRWVSEPAVSNIFMVTVLLSASGVLIVLSRFLCWKRARKARPPDQPKVKSSLGLPLEIFEGANRLSSRERQVVTLTLEGNSDSRIADGLGISKSTVGSLRRRSYSKLGVSGKRELMEAARRVADEVPISPERGGERASSPSFLGGLLLLVAMVAPLLVLTIFREGLLSAYAGWDGYSARGLTFFILLLASLLRGVRGEAPEERHRSSLILALAEGVCATLLAYGARAALGPSYAETPCWYAILLLLLLVVAEGYENGVELCRGKGALTSVLRTGIGSLPGISVYCILMGASSICLFDYVGYRSSAPGVSHGLQGFAEILAIVGVLLCAKVIAENRTISESGASSASVSECQSVLYLRGRGLSEAQAEAIALLAFGASQREVCLRCHVSSGSLGTFRSRAYKKLGVSSMDDLRLLLERETNMPKRDKTSPHK